MVDSKCQYIIDPNDRTTWSGSKQDCYLEEEYYNDTKHERSVWRCPRRSIVGKKYCPFHTEDSHRGLSAQSAFLHTVTGKMYTELPTEARFCFYGSKFDGFYIHSGGISTPENNEIKLSHSEFEAEFGLRDISADVSIEFDGCSFSSNTSIDQVKCTSLSFEGSIFSDKFQTEGVCYIDTFNFQSAIFEQNANFSAIFSEYLLFDGAEFQEESEFIADKIDFIATFSDATFKKSANFCHISTNYAMFDEATFHEIAAFNEATFTGRADFSNCTFYNGSGFEDAEFEKKADFSRCVFGGGVLFSDAIFRGRADFSNCSLFNCTFDSTTFIDMADFTVSLDEIPENPEKYSVFHSSCSFDGVRFKSVADFRSLIGENKEPTSKIPTFQSDTSFKNAIFDRGAKFDNASSSTDENSEINFLRANMPRSTFQDSELDNWIFTDANLTESDFSGASLVDANLERANLTRVNLFSANLSKSMIYSAILSDIQIDDSTIFGDHYIQDYKNIENNKEEKVEKSIWSSRAVERISYANARSRQGRSAYFTRKNFTRGLEKKRKNCRSWFRLTASRYFWRYGDGIVEIGLVSLSTIIVFALLYPIIGGLSVSAAPNEILMISWQLNDVTLIEKQSMKYRIFTNSLYYSLTTFTTLGSSLQPASPLAKAATTIQSLLENILLAAFIFVLGRRATR